MARCPEVNSSGCEPPFLPPSFPQSGTGFAPPISNFYSEISFIFAVNVLYLSCDCRTRLKKRRKRVSFWGSSAIAAYPRKGTITFFSVVLHPAQSDCSLSPQGDDNFIFCSSIILPFYCSLSPRKGTITAFAKNAINGQTKHCSLSPQGDDNYTVEAEQTSATIAAYPRKGTITLDALAFFLPIVLQLIPARGR